MSATRTFHLGDILSVTTGRLVSPRHMDGIYDILGWMAGESLWTHQLPRVASECSGPLLAQHPDLAEIEAPAEFGDGSRDSAKEAVDRWLAAQVAVYGEAREVAALDPGDHTHIDPLDEIRIVAPHAEVITVAVDDEEQS